MNTRSGKGKQKPIIYIYSPWFFPCRNLSVWPLSLQQAVSASLGQSQSSRPRLGGLQ